MKRKNIFLALALSLMLALTGCSGLDIVDEVMTEDSSSEYEDIYYDDDDAFTVDIPSVEENDGEEEEREEDNIPIDVEINDEPTDIGSEFNIPPYSGEPYVVINGNEPFFSGGERQSTEPFEDYSNFDNLGRCGVAYANICQELMPTDSRESISSVKPSGWNNKKYDFVDGGYIYNRCHLIGFQLAGENANEYNLITGTRYMNVTGMLPFENMIADYVHETNNHVLYRVTPIYSGDNLVADGVLMEAYSVEDNGDGILFNVFCYNVQPGCEINYANGDNWLSGETVYSVNETQNTSNESSNNADYILNTNSKKFHLPSCPSAEKTSEKNKKSFNGSRDELINQGYEPCGSCKP